MSRFPLQVVIPQWKDRVAFSQRTKNKFWEWKDRDKLPKKYKDILASTPLISGSKAYCVGSDGSGVMLKNTKKAGTPNEWVLNGQTLYNAVLNWRQRKIVAKYYHDYFSGYIKAQLTPIKFNGEVLSVSCDIYEVQRGQMPDVSNMWLLEKFFEDALQECGIIPDDSPKYIMESGRKRYHWVESEEERKLVFTIQVLN